MAHLPKKMSFVVFILAIAIIATLRTQIANTQRSGDPTTLAHEAFNRISEIYRSGGEAPELVVRLNIALGWIQEAQIRRSQGDEADALRLEDQARAEISAIMSDIPAAYEKAQRDSIARTLEVITSIPLTVASSTLVFYVGLRTWRWYEKIRIFEMKIVEKKKKD